MRFIKRIFLLLIINLLVMFTIGFLISFFHIQPYLNSYGLSIKHLAVFCIIWGFAGSFISLLLSRQMAKWMMGVKIVDEYTQNPAQINLLNIIKKISYDSGMKYIPEVGVYESNEINAFATGPSQKKSLVAVSSGLLHKMNNDELEGVLGHELSHIMNGDMITMTLLQGIVNAFVMFLARVLAFLLTSSKEKSRSYTSMRMLTFLFEMVFMVLGSIVLFAYSRKREFRADISSAKIVGKDKMIKALLALKTTQDIVDEKKLVPAYQAFKISSNKKGKIFNLFLSHPPLDERIKKLQDL